MTTSLASTERRLTMIFVGGAFLFLVLFEGFFLVSRFVLEERFSTERFTEDITRIESRSRSFDMPRDDGAALAEKRGPRIGINSFSIDSDGNILTGQTGGREDDIELESIEKDVLADLATGTIIKSDGLIFYRKEIPDGSGVSRVFVKRSGYPLEDLLRDIFRFLVMDLLIVAPFYFMGRYFVRETLKPVEENMDAMSHFIHNAGHELKTPLAIISGNLQILRDTDGKDEALVTESLSTITNMSESLDGLLELSKLHRAEKYTPTNILHAIEEELELQKGVIDTKDLTVKIDIKKGMTFPIERKHFSLLFGNLLKNAINYNHDGGTIEISGTSRTLKLRDTGIGMTEEEQEKIWERFYRADRSGKIAGNGIGLSIVDRIVKLYGLSIHVESEKGVGSTFILEKK